MSNLLSKLFTFELILFFVIHDLKLCEFLIKLRS